jgi:hypothetical protein
MVAMPAMYIAMENPVSCQAAAITTGIRAIGMPHWIDSGASSVRAGTPAERVLAVIALWTVGPVAHRGEGAPAFHHGFDRLVPAQGRMVAVLVIQHLSRGHVRTEK